jgi:hypothetical protein
MFIQCGAACQVKSERRMAETTGTEGAEETGTEGAEDGNGGGGGNGLTRRNGDEMKRLAVLEW